MNSLATTIATREVPKGSLALYWLCQAGFAFKSSAGQIVYIDPYLSDVVERVVGLQAHDDLPSGGGGGRCRFDHLYP